MQNYIEKKYCEICNIKGLEVYKKNFNDSIITNFFTKFYGANNTKLLYEFVKDMEYVLFVCEKCQYLWQQNQPYGELAFILYEKVIDKNESFKKSLNLKRTSEIRYNSEFDFIYNYFGKQKLNILDFGAGWGSWLENISIDKANLFAFEVSPSREKHLSQIRSIQLLNESELKVRLNFFDFIRLEQVLEHITELQSSIELVTKIIKPGGIVSVGVPDGKNIIKNLRNLKVDKGPIQPLEHINCFTNNSLTKIFSKNNLYKFSKKDLFSTHLKNRPYNLDKFKYLISDFRKNTNSTSIKFIKKD